MVLSRTRKQFLFGCYVSLYRKLEVRFARKSDTEGLEISWKAKRKKYIDENFGALKETTVAPKEKRSAAMHRGFIAGQDIEIRPGVNAAPTNNKPALGFESRLLGN